MDKNDFERLYAYNRWANEIIRQFVEKISVEELTRDLKSSFPTIRATLDHLIMAEWVWLERINGTSPTSPFYGETFPDLDSLFKMEADRRELQNYLAQISDDEILRTIEYKNLAGEANARCVAHILPHVVNHGTYHRGQITAFLRQIGAEAKSTDMIFFQS